jgi:hypothetical protein
MAGAQTVEVNNPAEALRNQDGTFKVISPFGYIFQVTCRQGSKMLIREIGISEAHERSGSVTWRIEKIA